jgi:TFIIF-interacting CTD phosphatase-like protein
MTNLNCPMSNFLFVYDREFCNYKFSEGIIIKKLDRVRRALSFPIEKMLIVDDKPETAVDNYGNLIRIEPFYSDNQDKELLKLISYLETIKNAENFRNIEKRGWSNN